MSEVTENTQVRIITEMPTELRDEIDAIAQRLDLSRSQLIRRACRELVLRLSGRLIDMSDGAIVEVSE